MDIYRAVPVYYAFYPDYENDLPALVQGNINQRLLESIRNTVTVSYVDESDWTQGMSITIGDFEPVVVAEGGFLVNTATGAIDLEMDSDPNKGAFLVVGVAIPNSDKH